VSKTCRTWASRRRTSAGSIDPRDARFPTAVASKGRRRFTAAATFNIRLSLVIAAIRPAAQLGPERRFGEAARTAIGIDCGANVLLGPMEPLSAGNADHRVIVKRDDGGNAALARQPRQVQRQIQQAVDVDDIRTDRVEERGNAIVQPWRGIGLVEASEFPVVDDFDDRQGVFRAPPQRAMVRGRVVLRAEHPDVVTRREGRGEIVVVDFRPGAVSRQKS
jgi:hypothetical protein